MGIFFVLGTDNAARKERYGLRLSFAVLKIQWDFNFIALTAIRLSITFTFCCFMSTVIGMKQKEQKNTGKQTGGFRRQ